MSVVDDGGRTAVVIVSHGGAVPSISVIHVNLQVRTINFPILNGYSYL